ncbi:hypothetical protein BVG16_21840 [Paenibacillus selenitireducens]|uniref:Uncharacterized protein n=1 Tax=Paenibacillus selenitireducens TaxID=1324314 RepID=A0A1T2X6M1_9BACL|nr:hypothetical protein [Paenibacillus selenitireducens]OPA75243.1 hypothetical protein BVG16_21840 [Paenibacillus selenitireducens]
MNHKHMMKRLALSTLLLSAVASPVMANAAENSEAQASTPTMKAIALQKDGNTKFAPFAIMLSNPLDLAKTYAPDTVQDWEATLDKFDKLASSKFTKMTASTTVSATEQTDVKPNITELKVERKLVSGKDSSDKMPANAVKMIKVESAHDAQDGDITFTETKGLNVEVKTGVAITTDSGEIKDPFFKAQIELSKAEQSKDADQIKQSLANLLEQYKQRIADWEVEK